MVRLFEHLGTMGACDFGEKMVWTGVRRSQAGLTVDDVLRQLGGDPGTITTYRPIDVGYDDEAVFLEQHSDAVTVVRYHADNDEHDVLRRLSQDAVVHEVFWLINNFTRLCYAVDGVLVTELNALNPHKRWGTDPDAVTGHLSALFELRDREQVPWPDWETAMATVESLTGLDWMRTSSTAHRYSQGPAATRGREDHHSVQALPAQKK